MESEEVGVDGLNGKNFHSSKYKTVPYKIGILLPKLSEKIVLVIEKKI